ncbi:RagB/SusD family nutrient uptake outer membrane protein [Puia dinghuensis]|uniref:RagB/SusD family nutrient uptake outer membrane protein n=1 Tax=Puia dinghuensis TaxID=1792502 RepID=UPI0016666469|nr:RagB/SusD family nutrient uptake outer membrane protein [Puia dinghuensis]
MRFPILILFLSTILILQACNKFVDVNSPVTSINSQNVYATDATAAAVLTGVYAQMSANHFPTGSSANGFGLTSTSLFSELSADELTLLHGQANAAEAAYYNNSLASNTSGGEFWTGIYPMIYTVNSALDGLSGNSLLTPAVKQQLIGEAKFIRAFCYFYLVNLYGDVPLITSTDYTMAAGASRTPQALVWRQIIQDLLQAQSLLSQNYLDATLLNVSSQRLRPTSWSAAALLARAYLYMQSWDSASIEATVVINNSTQFGLSSQSNAFLSNSSEAIWQLQPVFAGENTVDAIAFILPVSGPSKVHPFYLSNTLLNSFEPGDGRRYTWIDSVTVSGLTYYYPFKYKVNTFNAPVTEYSTVLRLGELYLIRAEAQAQGAGNGINGAVADLNSIRNRAGLPNYAGAMDKNSLLKAILHERQVELFTEWGHRWFDLKRTGAIDSVMGPPGNRCLGKSGQTWQSTWEWYPIPLSELQADVKLVQNSGY